MKNRKIIHLLLALLATALLLLGISGCVTTGDDCVHEWTDANCTTPKTCSLCNETEGEALGHSWTAANCTTPKTCSVCNETEGEALGHSWVDATCQSPKTCSVCETTEGEVGSHTWANATCEAPKTCTTCNSIEGAALGHDWDVWSSENGTHTHTCKNDPTHTESGTCSGGTATCESAAICSVCAHEYGTATGHSWGEYATTTAPGCTTTGVETSSCANCPATRTNILQATGHSYTDATTDPTCTEKGYVTHTCNCGHSYVDTYTSELGHNWNIPAPTCEDAQECSRCDASNAATGHAYAESARTDADCDAAGTVTYTCPKCEDSYTDTVGSALGHNIAGVEPTLEQVSGNACQFVRHYECARCHEDVVGETVTQHANLTASITTPATCQNPGVKTLTCSACGHSDTEEIPVDTVTGHAWVEGTVTSGKRTDTCSTCGGQKTVTILDSSTSTNVNDLKDTDILLDSGANINLGNAANNIGDKNVTISAGTLGDQDIADLGLSTDQLNQVGNNPIYNFIINDGTQNITDFGEDGFITVTLPYTLEPGENVDNIAVWYIDENGELTSIKATYNNGYVTFQTNHFSYYTVTRLTPKERCELYGHNYRTTVVPGSCTADGYTLYFCIRCGHSEKGNVVTAPGHNYNVTSVPATCTTSGSETYACSACDHSYTTVSPALGHDWEVESTVGVSCMTAGRTVYVCENANCSETWTELTAQLDHNLEDTVVSPTCTTGGYTVHTCRNDGCTYTYTDSATAALGHDYQATFEWNQDYTSVKAVLRCSRDQSGDYVAEYANLEIIQRNTPATCQNPGEILYIARVTHNGQVYEDTKAVAYADAYAHTPGTTWSHDDAQHWHVCSVCEGRVDAADHTFDKGTVTKAPTCAETGTIVYKCTCGYEKTDVVPATGEHSFANGTCSVCGKLENPECDHSELTETVTLDLSQYGVCFNSFSYQTCACGEVKSIDYEAFETIIGEGACEWDEGDYDYGEEEDGTQWATMWVICEKCQLKISLMQTMKVDGCLYWIEAEMDFEINGTVILEDLLCITDREEDHADKRVELDMTQHGACGGTLKVYRCEECQKITGLSDYDLTCELVEKVETVKDANGVDHSVYSLSCSECGLVLIGEQWREVSADSACEYTDCFKTTVKVGQTLVFEVIEESRSSNHEYETTYQLHGTTCTDGYTATESCKKCGRSYTYKGDYHNTEYKVLDLSQLSTCGGTVSGYCCRICNKFTNVERMNPGCDLDGSNAVTSTTTDANGNVHTVMTMTCADCGLVYVSESWTEQPTACITKTYMGVTISKDGTVVVDVLMSEVDEDHQYIYSNVVFKNGVDCTGGYNADYACSICGEADRMSGSGHYATMKDFELDLSEHGGCGGIITGERCDLCGYLEVYNISIKCTIGEESEPVESVDANGNKHYITTAACTECGLVFQVDEWMASPAGCVTVYHEDMIILKDGVELVKLPMYEIEENHDYETEIAYHGESCADGFSVKYACKACGHTTSSGYGPHGLIKQYELKDSDCEYGHSYVRYGCPCGQKTQIIYQGMDLLSYGKLEPISCEDCGLHLTVTSTETPDGCTIEKYVAVELSIGGEILDQHEQTVTYVEHTNETTASYGEDGSLCISILCTVCQQQTAAEYGLAELVYDEESGTYFYDLEHTPTESGRYTIASYNNSDTYVVLYELVDGSLKELDSDDDSGYHSNFSLSYALEAGKTYVWRISYLSDERSGTITYQYGTSVSGGCSCSYNEESSLYVLPEGVTSCEDGVVRLGICSGCETITAVEIRTENYHPTESFHIDLSEYGMCYGTIEGYSCLCGAEGYFNRNICAEHVSGEETTDENGDVHYITTYACEQCGLIWVEDEYVVRKGCYGYHTVTVNASINGQPIIEDLILPRGRSEYHVYEYRYEFDGEKNCEEGVTIHRSCSNCDFSYKSHYTWHYSYRMEEIDLSEYSSCGGMLYVESCPCGVQTYIGRKFDYTDYNQSTYVDEEKREHLVEVYTCTECDLRLQVDSYTVRDASTCTALTHSSLALSVGENMVYDKTFTFSRESHNIETSGILTEGSASCEDGVTILARCLDCDYSNEYTTYYHETFLKDRYDLSAEENGSALCGGYLSIYGCACGQEGYYTLDEARCDFDYQGIDPWVENYAPYGYVQTAQYPGNYGEAYFSYDFTLLACAVSNPTACTYKIRYADYYELLEGCMAQRYLVFQLGYDVETETYKTEIRVPMGEPRAYHAYTVSNTSETDETTGITTNCETHTCEACGSYYYRKNAYNANGYTILVDRCWVNTLEDGRRKLYQHLREYDENGDLTLELYKRIEADGTESWERNEVTITEIEAPYGDEAYERVNLHTTSSGESSTDTYAWFYYKGYEFILREYSVKGDDYWYRYDYEYNLNGTCERTTTYTNSEGESWSKPGTCHHTYWTELEGAGCTQDGMCGDWCPVCEQFVGEFYPINPDGHNWSYITDGLYVCSECGMENAVGANGDIVFEDFTELYGNDENYVIGYYADSKVQFIYYVSLILNTPLENGDNEVILDGIEIFELDEVRALAFSKAAVAAAAEALGYTADQYVVRFAFVPVGADGTLDYAITFGDLVADAPYQKYTIPAGDNAYIDIPFTATETGYWTLYGASGFDSVGILLDAAGSEITSDDDSDGNGDFRMDIYLESGINYVLRVRPYHNKLESDSVIYIFIEAPVVEDDGSDDEVVEGDSSKDEVVEGDSSDALYQTYIVPAGNSEDIYIEINFTATETGYWTIYAVSGFDSYGSVLDATGCEIACNDNDNGNDDFYFEVYLESGSEYRLFAFPYSGYLENESWIQIFIEPPVVEGDGSDDEVAGGTDIPAEGEVTNPDYSEDDTVTVDKVVTEDGSVVVNPDYVVTEDKVVAEDGSIVING